MTLCCSPVEENTEFLEDLRKASNGKGVILMCEAGGTTKPSPNFAAGKASRSLKVSPSMQLICLWQLRPCVSAILLPAATKATPHDKHGTELEMGLHAKRRQSVSLLLQLVFSLLQAWPARASSQALAILVAFSMAISHVPSVSSSRIKGCAPLPTWLTEWYDWV